MKRETYRYERVTPGLLLRDFRFAPDAARAGDPMPEFDLPTTNGTRIRRRDFAGRRPLLLIFGSLTCPMTKGSVSPLDRLHHEFGEQVEFVTLYVREAHPGERIGQTEMLEGKVEHARTMQQLHGVRWTVAVDDVDGTLHQALDAKPNAAYLVDSSGTIVFRSLWAGDEAGLRRALTAVTGGSAPTRSESRKMLGPMAQGLGHFQEVLRLAGRRAERDMLMAGPPIVLIGRVAALFRSLSPARRGAAAMVTLAAAALVVGVSLWSLS